MLPEWAPANVTLAQVLVAGGLLNEQLYLPVYSDHLLMWKVIAYVHKWQINGRGSSGCGLTSKLLFHSVSDGKCFLVQLLWVVLL